MREIKFEFGFTNHAPVVFTVTELMCGNFMNFISKDVGSVKYKRQFTGLQDKNGKEIYEGDLIKVNGETLKFNGESLFEPPEIVEFELISEVIYNDSIAAFDLSTIEADLNMKHWGFYGDDTNGHLEVIGNIHENPELLNK